MPKYVAVWQISGHKGRDIKPGEVVELAEDEAAEFIACGALRVAGAEPVAEAPVVEVAPVVVDPVVEQVVQPEVEVQQPAPEVPHVVPAVSQA